MKKSFKFFAATWLTAFLLFNLITLIVPAEIFGINRFEKPTFWLTYIFINLSFAAQLALGYFFCKNDTDEKMFLNIPVIKVGFTAVFTSLVVGLIFMLIPVIPTWIAAIVCIVITALFVLSGVKAAAAVSAVLGVEEKIAVKSAFITGATLKAEALLARAKGDFKSACEKVYEALKFSDVMSCDAARSVEETISARLVLLSEAVNSGNIEASEKEKDAILALVAERSALVKAAK